MGHSIKHPFDHIIYELMEDGLIKLTDGERTGLFDQSGRWIKGTSDNVIRKCAFGSGTGQTKAKQILTPMCLADTRWARVT